MFRLKYVGILAILLATWTFLSGVDCLVVPIRPDSTATNSATQQDNNATTMPKEIVMTLTMNNETITLNLTRNTNVPSDVPVIVAANGKHTTWKPNSDQFAVYYEMNSSASIVVEMRNESGQLVKICRGTLSISGIYYSVQPVDLSEGILVDIDGIDHMMRVEEAELEFVDHMDYKMSHKMSQDNFTDGPLFDVSSGIQNYVVEMAIFVDFTIYARLRSRSQAIDDVAKHNEAMQNIQYRFVQIANGVDMRYSTIKDPTFTIRVRLVGIYVASKQSDSPWTESSEVKVFSDNVGYTDMYLALNLFEKWLPTEIAQLKFTFDQATLFTGNSLYVNDSAECMKRPASCTKSGLSEIGQICELNSPKALSVSINKDFGIYSSIQTAAHELGHNLGALHDGDDYNSCSGSDQYIMASIPKVLTASDFNNAFTFSSCSVDYFRKKLAKITMTSKQNCLLVGSSSPTIVAPPNFAAYPGQQYSADQQCQDMYGPSSYYCAGGGSRDQTICQSMECWAPDKRTCEVKAEQRAYDGTKCGNQKWCMKGQCVYDSRAPASPDTCIYGDYKGQVQAQKGGQLSCYDIGRLQPTSCYLNQTSDACCQSCATIRANSKNSGCPYGDKDPEYCQSESKRSNCYYASYASTCCERCNTAKSSRVGCEYGDRKQGCLASDCYRSGADCCETCQRFYDSRYPGCEFGDTADWCATFIKGPEYCMRESETIPCCRSCVPYLKNGAAYQVCTDKASWCSSMSVGDCYNYPTLSTCCSTCSRYLRGN